MILTAPKPATIKGIREQIAERFVEFIKEVIEKYTDLSLTKDITVTSTIAHPYWQVQETTMVVIDIGSMAFTTPTLQPYKGEPYYEAEQYETLSGSVNIHCISKSELFADRLATLVVWALSANRRRLSQFGFTDVTLRAIAEPILIFEDETPNTISYIDEPVVAEFTYVTQYSIAPNSPIFRLFEFEAEVSTD